MRRLVLASLLAALTPNMSFSQSFTDIDWQLLAIDGVFIDAPATLRLTAEGEISGKAPCNAYGAQNRATLPALAVGPIRATKMACDRLAEEQAFFDALATMTEVRLEGGRNLVLRNAEGRTMEFVVDPMNSLTVCVTCPPDK